MLAAFYNRLPIWGQHLAVSTYGWYLRRQRYGGQFERRVAWWRHVQHLSREERDVLLTQRLRTILRIAIEHTLYGEQLSKQYGISPDNISHWTDIRELPILESERVRANPKSFINTALPSKEVCHTYTSGTTGSPLGVEVSLDALRDRYALLTIAEGWFGLDHKVRKATFNGQVIVPIHQSGPPYWRYNKAGNQLLMSIYHISPQTVQSYAHKLNKYRPQYIDGYPSAIYTMARLCLAEGIALPQPVAIRTWAEKVYDFQRQTIEQAFDAPIFDWYGLAENCCYAAQCPHGNYHVFDEYGIIEVIKDDRPANVGEEGDIIATSLSNSAMPLIRYNTGDRAVLGKPGCPCGSSFMVMSQIAGRSNEMLVTPEGRTVGQAALSLVFKHTHGLLESQITQHSPDSICVHLVVDKSFGPGQQDQLLGELRARLGSSMEIQLRRVQEIPRTDRGKYRLVESSLNVEDYLGQSITTQD